jgi:hypothetical protein
LSNPEVPRWKKSSWRTPGAINNQRGLHEDAISWHRDPVGNVAGNPH